MAIDSVCYVYVGKHVILFESRTHFSFKWKPHEYRSTDQILADGAFVHLVLYVPTKFIWSYIARYTCYKPVSTFFAHLSLVMLKNALSHGCKSNNCTRRLLSHRVSYDIDDASGELYL